MRLKALRQAALSEVSRAVLAGRILMIARIQAEEAARNAD